MKTVSDLPCPYNGPLLQIPLTPTHPTSRTINDPYLSILPTCPGSSRVVASSCVSTAGPSSFAPAPSLPEDVIAKTQALYRECLERLTA